MPFWQANRIYELEVTLKETRDALEESREKLKSNRAENINLQLENYQLRSELGFHETETDSGQGSISSVRSAPISQRTSPLGSDPIETRPNPNLDERKPLHLIQTMSLCIDEKDREIAQLKNMLQVF